MHLLQVLAVVFILLINFSNTLLVQLAQAHALTALLVPQHVLPAQAVPRSYMVAHASQAAPRVIMHHLQTPALVLKFVCYPFNMYPF